MTPNDDTREMRQYISINVCVCVSEEKTEEKSATS